MMRRTFNALLTAALFGYAFPALAGTGAEDVMAHDPYVRAVPPGQPNSAAFMHLHNGSQTAHALMSAESPAAAKVELHTHTMADGMMQMRKVEKIDLPAGQGVPLQPGGYHVMLIDLKQELKPDQPVELTLVFEDGSRQKIAAPVRSMQMQMQMPMQMPAGGQQHMH
jgi:copper(I)-binding protein